MLDRMKWKKLLLIGDSHIEYGFCNEGGWVSMLADLLKRRCDVINRGFSGYNTRHMKQILPEILQEFEAESTCGVIIVLG